MSVLLACTAQASPYRPAHDGEVLAHLPAQHDAGRLRAASAAAAGNATLAATLARGYLLRGREQGDPRLLGYAEGLLQPWRDDPAAPTELRLLRATLAQAAHRFDESLAELDGVIQREPTSAQAWLTRAAVLRVQGRYAQAAAACERLADIASAFLAGTCRAGVQGLRGEQARALATLAMLAPDAARQDAAVDAWFQGEYAELLERAGQREAAARRYVAALQRHPTDIALRTAYADLLLDGGEPAAVLALVRDCDGPDALCLRRTLAQAALGRTPAADIERLAQGYAAARRRAEAMHLREEARFTLVLRGDARTALDMAVQNWSVQREPADALLLLATAHAAGAAHAARPTLDWLDAQGLQDVRIAPLRAALERP